MPPWWREHGSSPRHSVTWGAPPAAAEFPTGHWRPPSRSSRGSSSWSSRSWSSTPPAPRSTPNPDRRPLDSRHRRLHTRPTRRPPGPFPTRTCSMPEASTTSLVPSTDQLNLTSRCSGSEKHHFFDDFQTQIAEGNACSDHVSRARQEFSSKLSQKVRGLAGPWLSNGVQQRVAHRTTRKTP